MTVETTVKPGRVGLNAQSKGKLRTPHDDRYDEYEDGTDRIGDGKAHDERLQREKAVERGQHYAERNVYDERYPKVKYNVKFGEFLHIDFPLENN